MARQPFPRPGESLADDREQTAGAKPPKPSGTRGLRTFHGDLDPRTARRIGCAVCVLAGCAFLVAATIVLLDLVLTHPLHVDWLLPLGIPILIVGQLWVIVIIAGRVPARAKGRWPFARRTRLTTSDFFGDLPRSARGAVFAITALLAVSAITVAPTLVNSGGPAPPTRHCQYPLDDHGVVTCTDEATYYRVGRDVQRFAATILAGFFVIHLSVAASGLVRRRDED